MRGLTPTEKRMVLRRLSERMLHSDDWHYSKATVAKLTCNMVAEWLSTTPRSVQRTLSELPKADKDVCPVCKEPMWVVNDIVEAHPDRLMDTCVMTGRIFRTRKRGLALVRPDLYEWLEVSA